MRPFVDTANVRCVCDKPRRWGRLPTATTSSTSSSFSSSSSSSSSCWFPRLFAPRLAVRLPLSPEGRPKRHRAGSIVRLVWCPASGVAARRFGIQLQQHKHKLPSLLQSSTNKLQHQQQQQQNQHMQQRPPCPL